MTLQKTHMKVAIGATILALLLLLGYSLERTIWLFGLFEQDQRLAIAAAIVVELAAVALLAGAGIIAKLDQDAQAWANRALAVILSVQALGNLSAGYLRGGQQTRALWGVQESWTGFAVAAYVVAAALWLVTNLAAPSLILCLSKLLEQMIAHYATLPELKVAPLRSAPVLASAQKKHSDSVSMSVTPGACKYCGKEGLSATERARHGKTKKRIGVCEA